jgi:hypothetical protein
VIVEIPAAPLRAIEEAVDNGELFSSWESTNEYLHNHQYGFGAAIVESCPSRADVMGLKQYYDNGSNEDKFMIDSAW